MNFLKFYLVLMLLGSFQLHAQIGAKVQQDNIFGAWYNDDYGFQMTLVLNADGSGEFDGEMLKYTIDGNTLVVTQFGAVTKYTFALQANKLTLSGGDLETAIAFSKNTDQSSVTNSKQATTITFTEEKISSDSDDKLIGTWSTNGENIEFIGGGYCNYMGQSFPFKTSPGLLTLTTKEGDVSFGYTISDDKLSLSYNQNTVTYTKGSSGVTGGNQTQDIGGGRVDQDLVGKWCYVDVNNIYGSSSSSSNSCITLNANGTYEYYSETSRSVNTPGYYGGTNSQGSDQGTWYVQGDRIYYNSQSKGPGSYKLEKRNHPKNVNDPMIILDGAAYVTAYQKAPWR